jgi:hypothetical protein
MGYNIEVSFNVLKTGNIQESVSSYAAECDCEQIYEDYEFENKVQFQRRHCIMNANFLQTNIVGLKDFLKFIKRQNGLYLESIYDDDSNIILYASQYYITQKMDKGCAKEFTIEKRKRSYSEDETMILHSIKKSTFPLLEKVEQK